MIGTILQALRDQEGRQIKRHNETMSMLRALLGKADSMNDQLTALQTEVANNTTVEQSAITLINGLAAQITAAGTDPVALGNLVTTLQANDAALAAAVAANTVAAPAAASTAGTDQAAS
jgi:hypothetical protein